MIVKTYSDNLLNNMGEPDHDLIAWLEQNGQKVTKETGEEAE